MMKDQEVIDYVNKYKESHEKDAIRNQLVKHGASHEQVNRAFHSKSWPSRSAHNKTTKLDLDKSKRYGIISLILAILSFFTIFIVIGILLVIPAIILGHKARKYNPNNGVALAGLIIGYITIVLGLFWILIFSGALMFAFVDFESMLPNKVELSNNLRADQTSSYARIEGENKYAVIATTYIGASKISFDPSSENSLIVTGFDGPACRLFAVKNSDTGSFSKTSQRQSVISLETRGVDLGQNQPVEFLNGQTGIFEFDCNNLGNTFKSEEYLEGEITLEFVNTRLNLSTPSSGSIRLVIE